MEGPSARRRSRSDKLLPRYLLGKKLGTGSFAKVYSAEHILTGHKVAVKILNLKKLNYSDAVKVRREIKILAAISHPHVIRLYEVIEKRSKIYVIMEYMNGGDLFDYITVRGRVREDEARYIFQQIISGVEFCHLSMVAHRDLKPENVLLDSKLTVKVADFGLSNVMHDGHFLKTICGSPNYASPEVISRKLYAGPEIDVWSCGVILYALLSGKLPFDGNDLPSLSNLIKNGIYTIPLHCSPGASDLIRRILIVDPMTRITIPEIRCHPWFQYKLPQYLSLPAEEIKERTKEIDADVVNKVTSMGFSRNLLMESLQKKVQNEGTVAYYLLLDKKCHFSSAYLNYGFRKDSEGGSSSNLNSSTPQELYTHDQRLQVSVGRNWILSLQSSARPRELMMDALRVFQRLNVCWKKIGHYNMKCRWLPNFSSRLQRAPSLDMNRVPSDVSSVICSTDGSNLQQQNDVKFEMQLYMAPEERYILDLQRISGPPLLFLEICASFLAQLQVL